MNDTANWYIFNIATARRNFHMTTAIQRVICSVKQNDVCHGMAVLPLINQSEWNKCHNLFAYVAFSLFKKIIAETYNQK